MDRSAGIKQFDQHTPLEESKVSPQPHDSAETGPAKDSPVSAKSTEVSLQAILVIHGIGQQQPFQPLDNFVNGLRNTIKHDHRYAVVTTTHLMHGRDEVFDHGVRIEATDPGGKLLNLRLDVYEFYWAPLTQEKASFFQIVRWLLATGFTPLRRLAFNLPLLIQRAENRAKPGLKDGQSRPAARSASPEAGQSPQLSGLRLAWAVFLEFLCEIRRVVFAVLGATVLAGITVGLVSHSSALVKRIQDALVLALQTIVTWQDTVTFTIALVATIAAFALLLSIPEQFYDLWRLQKVEPLFDEVAEVARNAYNTGSNFFGKVKAAASAGIPKLVDVWNNKHQWRIECQARIWLLPLSIVIFIIVACVVTMLYHPSPECFLGVCPRPVFYDLLHPLLKTDLFVVLLLLGIAYFLKHVFVDYLGDVALYTTADENSAFFATRIAIQNEVTRRVRYLLRDSQYESVAIAGHSLGSVIGYDAINFLRTEARILHPVGVWEALDSLATFVERLPSADAVIAKNLLGKLAHAIGEPVQPSKSAAGQCNRSATLPVTPNELAKLTTFITFGSPLNKVLYFFRTKIDIYETVRSHIIQEMHGYRQQENLLTRDPTIHDEPTNNVSDIMRWVNFYSPMDPVSGRLSYYRSVDEHRHWYLVWGQCHMSYWNDRKMYREILLALQPKAGIDYSKVNRG